MVSILKSFFEEPHREGRGFQQFIKKKRDGPVYKENQTQKPNILMNPEPHRDIEIFQCTTWSACECSDLGAQESILILFPHSVYALYRNIVNQP
jgi:hypothetical protein